MPKAASRKPRPRPGHHAGGVIGWQGITVCVPEDWHIGAIAGDDEEGYLRVQDDEMVRMEIKWQQAEKFVDMEGLVQRYLRDLERRSRRSQPPIKTRHSSRTKTQDELGRRSLVRFAWSGDRQGQGMAWLCGRCNRVVIAQVMAPLGEDVRGLARSIFSSFCDHADGGWRTWATYGFVAEVPESFKLASHKLMTGLLEFSFERDTEKLTLSRRALADVVLRKTSLLDWARAQLGRQLRDCACEADVATVHGDEAVLVSGRKSKLGPRMQRFLRHVMRRQYGDRVECLVWRCKHTNKIFTVESLVDVENCGLAHQVAQRIRCH